jgi:hypothetical protein
LAAVPQPPAGSFGNTIAAHGDKILISCSGAPNGVYAYARTVSGWQSRALVPLPSGDEILHHRGAKVALHDDTAIIAVRLYDDVGKAYVYHYSSTATDSGWQLSSRSLTGAVPGRNGFGYSVAFDGTTAMITAPDESNTRGAIYFFGIEQPGDN